MWQGVKTWIKDKWVRFKRYVVLALGIAAVSAAPLVVDVPPQVEVEVPGPQMVYPAGFDPSERYGIGFVVNRTLSPRLNARVTELLTQTERVDATLDGEIVPLRAFRLPDGRLVEVKVFYAINRNVDLTDKNRILTKAEELGIGGALEFATPQPQVELLRRLNQMMDEAGVDKRTVLDLTQPVPAKVYEKITTR